MIYPEFSFRALEDRHRLPIYEEVGTCGVSVGLMTRFVYDHSSWRIIRLRLMDVLRICVESRGVGIGGITITGEAKHMELLLSSTTANMEMAISNTTTADAR